MIVCFNTFNWKNFFTDVDLFIMYRHDTTAINNYVRLQESQQKQGLDMKSIMLVENNLEESAVLTSIFTLLCMRCFWYPFTQYKYIVLILGASHFG